MPRHPRRSERARRRPYPGGCPSEAATERLRDGVRHDLRGLQEDLTDDLILTLLHLDAGRVEAASQVVERQTDRLRRFQDEVGATVAAAAVEREAEGVLAAAQPGDVLASHPAERPTRDLPMRPVGGGPVRRLVSALALAAIGALGLGAVTGQMGLAPRLVANLVGAAASAGNGGGGAGIGSQGSGEAGPGTTGDSGTDVVPGSSVPGGQDGSGGGPGGSPGASPGADGGAGGSGFSPLSGLSGLLGQLVDDLPTGVATPLVPDVPQRSPDAEPSEQPSSDDQQAEPEPAPVPAGGDQEPSEEPSEEPSDEPSDEPSEDPSDEPSEEPSPSPSSGDQSGSSSQADDDGLPGGIPGGDD